MPLTAAVARALFRLMAYKDEYEVARLHLAASFTDQLHQDFEGDFKLRYHLAPPLLPLGRDGRGRPRKIALGGWMRLPFQVLARLKVLRGTVFDVFGRTAERRMERELIAWYEELVGRLLCEVPRHGTSKLAPIAAAALDIRGYGPVKEAAAKDVRRRVAAMLDALAHEEPTRRAA
jgi:indolepyruvate ferredoxin oxidoreductase